MGDRTGKPTLVQFPKVSRTDLVVQLRGLADKLERGTRELPVAAILVFGYENGFTEVFAVGSRTATNLETCGWLSRGMQLVNLPYCVMASEVRTET